MLDQLNVLHDRYILDAILNNLKIMELFAENKEDQVNVIEGCEISN